MTSKSYKLIPYVDALPDSTIQSLQAMWAWDIALILADAARRVECRV
jgi:hypothetical protein